MTDLLIVYVSVMCAAFFCCSSILEFLVYLLLMRTNGGMSDG